MKTDQFNVTVTKLPEYGEVQLWSAFDPSFWMNQEEIEHKIVTEQGETNLFGSTNEIYIMARCNYPADDTTIDKSKCLDF